MVTPPTTPRHAVCIVIYSVLCICFVSQNKAKKCYMVPSFTNIQPLILYASKYKKMNTTARQKNKQKQNKNRKQPHWRSWGGPLGQNQKKQQNQKPKKTKKSPHGRSSYPHSLFSFWGVFGLFVCFFFSFLYFFLKCFLDILLS